MKVTLLQMDLAWANPSENIRRADKAIDDNPGSDLYVLPEMFSTGFSTTPDGCIEDEPSPTLAWMKSKAAAKDCAIAGSVATHTDGKNVNRFYFVKPDGEVTIYDKRHLFTYGLEHHRFSAGRKRAVVEWRGVRFLLLVCYDVRFPVWIRNRGDYDAIICVANWPSVRRFAWDTLVRARAIEDQCFMLAVNRVGTDPVCEYNGGSVLLNPYGETVVSCPDGEQAACSAELDLEMLASYRAKFPVMEDADAFTLE